MCSAPNRRRCFDRLAFKKTCPFEFTRHGRPWAGTETRPALLPSEVSQVDIQKGKIRFSGERLKPKLIGLDKTALEHARTQADWAKQTHRRALR
ncbi:hypothetical protein LMED105_03145 [Limnobacter sp. MED105]|nr:hypothetical protein LMED105_03145 [Limnobacter sp. MED105]